LIKGVNPFDPLGKKGGGVQGASETDLGSLLRRGLRGK